MGTEFWEFTFIFGSVALHCFNEVLDYLKLAHHVTLDAQYSSAMAYGLGSHETQEQPTALSEPDIGLIETA